MKTLTQDRITSLKSEGRWSEIGQLFWNNFLFSEGKERKRINTLWESLSKTEKRLCEAC